MTGDILMSIRPRFADAILAGQKTHELRRRFADARPGARVIVYASGPRRAVVGMFTVASVHTMPAWMIARRRRRATTLSGDEIREYLVGVRSGTLIEVSAPTRFTQPISLSQLRSYGVEPPQSYRYLPSSIARKILSAGHRHQPAEPALTCSDGSVLLLGGRSLPAA